MADPDERIARVRGGPAGYRKIPLGQWREERKEKRGKIKPAKSLRQTGMKDKTHERTVRMLKAEEKLEEKREKKVDARTKRKEKAKAKRKEKAKAGGKK